LSSAFNKWFSDKQLQHIRECMVLRHMHDFDTLAQEKGGEFALILVQSGDVQLFVEGANGHELSVVHLVKGDILCLDVYTTWIAKGIQIHADAMVGMVAKEDFEGLSRRDAGIAASCLEWYRFTNAFLATKMRDLTLFGKKGAVASTLLRLANQYGRKVEKGILIDKKFTQEELGRTIGASRESVSRILLELEHLKVIAIERRKIIIRDISYIKAQHQCLNCAKELCRL